MIVTLKVRLPAELLAEILRVLVLLVLVGLKDAVTPLGSPDADRLTFPEKPLSGFTEIVVEAFDPRVTLMLLGEAESV